jgi:hypothetical protein
MATARKTTAHTVRYVKVGETKGTFKFQPADEESAITGTLYAKKGGDAQDLGTVEAFVITVQAE